MKPFSLEEALAGEPVKLRDGSKAYVKYVAPIEHYKGEYPIRGYVIDNTSSVGIRERYWTKKGNGYNDLGSEDRTDIISMWEEPRPRVILELPAPLKEPQEQMWYIAGFVVKPSTFAMRYKDHPQAHLFFNQRTYFATKEDAEEWLDAMRNARR